AAVTIVARRADDVAATVEAMRVAGHEANGVSLDVTDHAAVRHLVQAATVPFEILVNSAGTARHAAALDISEADYQAVMAINVGAALFAGQAVAARLVAAGRSGSIIHISSQMGHVGGPNRTVYAASKFAVEGMTRAMAIDLAVHR